MLKTVTLTYKNLCGHFMYFSIQMDKTFNSWAYDVASHPRLPNKLNDFRIEYYQLHIYLGA